MSYRLRVLTILALGALAASAQAGGNAAAGKSRSVTCVGCHGPNGISLTPVYPNLAGQKEDYLVKAMNAYRSGERTDPTMKAMATPLSDQDVLDLAAYYASLSCQQ